MAEPLIRSRRLLAQHKCKHEDEARSLGQQVHELTVRLKKLQDITDHKMEQALERERTENLRLRRKITELQHQVGEWKEAYKLKYRKLDRNKQTRIPVLEELDDK